MQQILKQIQSRSIIKTVFKKKILLTLKKLEAENPILLGFHQFTKTARR